MGKSLERVQGSARLELETYRVAARMAAYEQAERLRKARYEALQREESRVLREQSQGGPRKVGRRAAATARRGGRSVCRPRRKA